MSYFFNGKFLQNFLLNKNLSEGCVARSRESLPYGTARARSVCKHTLFIKI
ncbi:hypothetical protein GCWU000282_00685 [Catonella morbi ATCC 51271]|uniref:Uncharacterized protein n=1 Tax=Catonella morbi ATCC 51271 TaxID=592026 RepID=V2ZBN4_9FIRM|nr:hypothetical protein GCWU000282_00685 [Catonella morbi ATCC 51271]